MKTENIKKYQKDEPASVIRKKSKKLEESRNDWKEKNQEKHKSIKAIKARLEETKNSRECWKVDCLKNANDLKDSEDKIQELEQALLKERLEKLHLYEEIEALKKKTSRRT